MALCWHVWWVLNTRLYRLVNMKQKYYTDDETHLYVSVIRVNFSSV